MSTASASLAALSRPALSLPKQPLQKKKSHAVPFVCLNSGDSSLEISIGGDSSLRLRSILHNWMDAEGFETKRARSERDNFCKQVGDLTTVCSETSIAIGMGVNLARTAMHIAAEDDALSSPSSEPIPFEASIEKLDTLSMEFCSLYIHRSSSCPEDFLRSLEMFLYVHKGFCRTDSMSDARSLYLHSVLACRTGSLVMLSLIYSEMLKALRRYGLVNFDAELYFPHDLLSLPRAYQKQKGKSSDLAHILTSKSFLLEVLRNLKNAFWPFQCNHSDSLFMRAAQAKPEEESHSKLYIGLQAASPKDTRHKLGSGDMRRALAACERLILLGSQPEELRDYAVLLYHCGQYEDCLDYLKVYQTSRTRRFNLSRTDAMEENTVEKLAARVNQILEERGWSRQSAARVKL